MRASPAFQLTVQRHGVWRAAVAALIGLAAATLLAWALAPSDKPAMELRWLLAALGVQVLLLAATLLRRAPLSLRWDGDSWHLGPASLVGEEPWSGSMAVSIDLEAWLLLKFEVDGGPPWGRTRWLPIQRRGIEAQWHALRCAVYCARPEPGRPGGAHGGR